MQLTGNASVTNGLSTVDAAVGLDWSQAAAGSWFTRKDSFVTYTIAAPPTFIGGRWRIALSANYAGITEPAAPCVVMKDFTDKGWPLFAFGDTEVLSLLNRWGMAITNSSPVPPAPDPDQIQTDAGESLQTDAGENIIAEP
jgi:hypothetical protein